MTSKGKKISFLCSIDCFQSLRIQGSKLSPVNKKSTWVFFNTW